MCGTIYNNFQWFLNYIFYTSFYFFPAQKSKSLSIPTHLEPPRGVVRCVTRNHNNCLDLLAQHEWYVELSKLTFSWSQRRPWGRRRPGRLSSHQQVWTCWAVCNTRPPLACTPPLGGMQPLCPPCPSAGCAPCDIQNNSRKHTNNIFIFLPTKYRKMRLKRIVVKV